MPTPDHAAETGPILFMPDERVLIEAAVVTSFATGCRVKVPGMTPGLTNYVGAERSVIRKWVPR